MSYAYYMPSKRERYYASKAGNTHAIWSRVISDDEEPKTITDPAGEQLWLGLRHRVMSVKAKQGTSSTCKRCNGCGHFTFECRNHLSLAPSTVRGGQAVVPATVQYQLTTEDSDTFNWSALLKRHEYADAESGTGVVQYESATRAKSSKKRKRSDDEHKSEKRKHKKRK